jgi:hypothetical protein
MRNRRADLADNRADVNTERNTRMRNTSLRNQG